MMMKDIGDYLITKINKLSWQKTLFMGQIPDDMMNSLLASVLLTQSSADASPVTWDGETVRLSVDVRWNVGEKGMESSSEMIYNIKNELHMKKDFIMNGTHYICITITGGPYFSGMDARKRPIWRAEFSIVKGLDGEA